MKKKQLKIFGLISILVTISFSSWLQAKTTDNPKNFLITAKTIDVSLEQAKVKALSEISQNIFVSIKSDLKTKEKLENNQYSSKADIITKVSSQGYFKGIVFFNDKKLGKNKYQVVAGFSEKSYNDTVFFLKNQIVLANNQSLSEEALFKQYQMGEFFLALLSYGKNHNLSFDEEYFNQLSTYIEKLRIRFNSDAVVTFVSDNPNCEIVFNKKKYLAMEEIYLSSGKYTFLVQSKGYQSKKVELDVRNGDKIKYPVVLQKKLSTPLNIKLNLKNSSYLDTNLVKNLVLTMIEDNQMQKVSNSINQLNIEISNIEVEKKFNDYFLITLVVSIDLSGKYNKSTNVSINYLSKNKNDKITFNIFKQQLLEKSTNFFSEIYN